MPLPRLFTQFPPHVAHFAIVSPSAHLISLIISSFIPPPAALSPPFPVLSVVSPLSLGCDFHPSFVSLSSLCSPRSSFLIYFSFPSVFLFQPCVHPCFLVLFLLHPFPPPAPFLQVFLTSSPPPCISSLPRPSPILRSPHSCRAITVGMMGHNSPEPGPPRTRSH